MLPKLKDKLEDLRDSYQRLSPRERRALGLLGGIFGVLIVVGMAYVAISSVQDIEDEIESTRLALRDLERYRQAYIDNKLRQAALEQRIPTTSLELNAYVEKVASGVDIKIDESNEAKPTSEGPYNKRGLEVKLRRISVEKLGRFLEKLVSSTQNIVQVTELSVSTRWGQQQELDVELVIATYDRNNEGTKRRSIEREEKGG